MTETTRDLTREERQRSQQARRQFAEALKRPPAVAALVAAREAAASRVVGSTGTTVAASARRVRLAQTAARAVGTSSAGQWALTAALDPSIGQLARGGVAGVHIGNLLGLQQSVVAGLAVGIGRFGAFSQMQSLTKTVNEATGVSALSKTVQRLGASVLADCAKGPDLNRLLVPAMPNLNVLAGAIVRPAFEQIHETLNAWFRGLGSFDRIGRSLARYPLFAALRARKAALQGDLAAVRDFIIEWLERRPTDPVVQATIDALLEDDWVPDEDDLIDVEVIEHLRLRTTDRFTRRYKLLGETQVLGRRVDSLDRLVLAPSGDLVPLVAVTADPSSRPAQDLDPADARRARSALAKFKPEEQKVLWSWEPGMTWQEAATAAGLTPDVAERVRRKRKRVAAEEARRLAQRPA